ncbi:protein SCO1/2 [Pontibacter ummariensis]|uniref:Protein SCO1/2 n=1 Tax=Pontibacter ummariensis TaxID=1610492 RepID=A0A239DQ63_9BACT|nr:SCO family protein [Pontibacter ummariensis]PRY13820.1 protein SCO1/2 [Pontibacter ummariensis]SNS34309.1 protein SCO1/2 [Pontibacter ummariensis]
MKLIIFKHSLHLSLLFIMVMLLSCKEKEERLPILGPREVQAGDTLYHTIPDFAFADQDSSLVTPETFQGDIYVADFFFTSCPTICPKMKSQMLRVYEKYQGNDNVKFLSHSIDPAHDTVAVLRDYADRLGVDAGKWHFITGDRDAIFDIAQNSYMASAMEDEKEPSGLVHSGAFLLIDSQRRVRGHYDGTKAEEVDQLMRDMDLLLKEERLTEK